MTLSTISKYFESAREVYRSANVNFGVRLSQSQLEGQNKTTMSGFDTNQAEYVAATAEALILILDENFAKEWLGTVQLSADYILSLAEILYDRGIDNYDMFDYLATYDTLDDVISYDINSGDDEFNLLF